ncbi:MAG: lysine biosynthesis protein LysW [Methanobacteriota archaeon]|nr:MAG: lysine biosynthesis protein LysW [Euryarchaeota archaeon]
MELNNQSITTYLCPVCDGENSINEQLEIGELLDCFECGSELEVVNTSPLELIESEIEAEDWGQ